MAREKAGYSTPAAACAAFGWKYPTYAGHENGWGGIRIGMAERYAQAFRVNLGWLLTGKGEMDGTDVPVLGTEPSFGSARGAFPRQGKAPARPRNRLGELLVARGVDGRDLAKRTGIAQRRLAAIADGAEVTQAELDRIAEALGLGVFDIFDFAPMTRDEAALLIDLRHISDADRQQVRGYIDLMKLRAANDQRPAKKAGAKRSA